ncbi:extensin family protein [Loktanella sp. SALINAS62]|uniref:extensin-like domain-containing protein n=1 Tax=Loktanella sp. SALINAS62 TaxID=2706124 RepID=UPI001B8C2736|nr:extensin family protein [Loktanella sp. SALINAS62]MBS1300876.1 extensin family protein [Loktanella sp. SALINAS62]
MRVALALLLVCAGQAWAQAPDSTKRPLARAGTTAVTAQTVPQVPATADVSAYAPRLVARPDLRPAGIVTQASERQAARIKGAVCGDPDIQGETMGNIGGPGACGVEGAVLVRSVVGVTMQPAPTIDCRTASALKDWVATGIKPAVGTTGGGVSRLRIVGHYACRSRVGGGSANNRMSEHAFGRAVDIGGIGLASGREITVLTDWNKGQAGAQLADMWRSACGIFGTVLGPNANAAHRDHFHVDTASYRTGSYCR